MCQFDSTLTFDLCGGVQNKLEKTEDCKIPQCMHSKLHSTVCKQPKIHSNSCKDLREIRYITNQSEEKCRKECKFVQDRHNEAYRAACDRIASAVPNSSWTPLSQRTENELDQRPINNTKTNQATQESFIDEVSNVTVSNMQGSSTSHLARPSPLPLSRSSRSRSRTGSDMGEAASGSKSGSLFRNASTTALAGSQASMMTRRASSSYESDAASTKALYNVSM